MLKNILILIGMIITLIGTVMVFDARYLTKKFFGFGDQNEATKGLKILGFILAMIGAIVAYVNLYM